MLFDIVFSVATGVGGFECTISDMAVHMDVAFWQFSENPSTSAYVADTIPFIVILHSTCTDPFSGVIDIIGVLLLDFLPRGEYPPALLCASGSKM